VILFGMLAMMESTLVLLVVRCIF